MVRKLLVLVAIAIPFALAACGGSSDSTSTAASSTESSTSASTTASSGGSSGPVAVSETEYKIDPSDPTVKAGKVTFDVTNDGSVTHNMVISGNGVEETTDDLSPGSKGTVTADLKPGTYEIFCSIDGHKDLGMDGTVTVQ